MNKFPLITLGWRERIKLPALNVPQITCKVDTGARSSSLHALDIEVFQRAGKDIVRYAVQPFRKKPDLVVHCESEFVDKRVVTNSGGQRETRVVILTPIEIGTQRFDIEVTLTDRLTMRYQMLLGRTGMRGRFLVDPSQSFLVGKKQR